jgi:hypothetical protein
LGNDQVGLIYDYIRSLDDIGFEEEASEFQVFQPLPKKIFDNKDQTLREAGLYPKASILTVKELN